MSINITASAASQIARKLASHGNSIGLRLGVKQSGCSGYAYVIDFADAMQTGDIVFEQHGVKVLVCPEDLDKLDGIELDYTKEGFSEAFRFNNPNSKGTCGCGESFSV